MGTIAIELRLDLDPSSLSLHTTSKRCTFLESWNHMLYFQIVQKFPALRWSMRAAPGALLAMSHYSVCIPGVGAELSAPVGSLQ